MPPAYSRPPGLTCKTKHGNCWGALRFMGLILHQLTACPGSEPRAYPHFCGFPPYLSAKRRNLPAPAEAEAHPKMAMPFLMNTLVNAVPVNWLP
jgi:hypothetical protein